MYSVVINSSLRFAILQYLNEAGCVASNGFFPKKYSRTGTLRWLLGLDYRTYPFVGHAKRSLSSTLSFLKKESFIRREGARKKTTWIIDKKGKDFIKQYAKSMAAQRIISSRILYPLQKSVYRGECPLLEELLIEIHEKGLHKSVHIMSLDKLGTVGKMG